MANQKLRNKLIDAFNDELEKISSEKISREYSKVLNAIQKEALALLNESGDLKLGDLRKILNRHPLSAKIYRQSILNSYIGSGVSLIIENPNLKGKDLNRLAPIKELLKTTSITKPKILANRINLFTKIIMSDRDGPVKFQGAIVSLKEYVGERNAKTITRIAREFNSEMGKLNNKIQTQLSRDMVRDLRKFQKSTTIFAQDGERLNQRRPLTQNEINNKMHRKYGNAATRVDRIIETEVHAQNEMIRQLDAKQKGYDTKRWIPDTGVKNPRKHHRGQIENQRPKVGEKFVINNRKTGRVSYADYPGDQQLPVEERVYCHCKVAYSK